GLHVSKEVARKFYRKTKWYKDVEEAKRKAETQGIKDWRNICRSKPPPLDQRLKRLISEIYMAAANELTNRQLFETPTLAEVIEKYRKYLEENL
ncbi:phosphoribosylaminoimidazolesuccinocarboxamide synthase, partial [Candidatus Bathyarchaeota archaeon]